MMEDAQHAAFCEIEGAEVDELVQALKEEAANRIEFLIRIGPPEYKVSMYAKEHAPPHFHVEKDGNGMSFSICDCSVVDGSQFSGKELKIIREFWRDHRSKLIKRWDESRPSDCPVGKFRPEWCQR